MVVVCMKSGKMGTLPPMKTVLIIGASGGIGKETAALFLQKGFRVVNISRTPCSLPGVENKLCDVTQREKLDETLTALKDEDVACFVYSAGFSLSAPLEYVREEDYRYLFEVNFFAFLHVLQTFLPTLRANAGTVCVVGSLAACLPIPFDPYYSASKAALNALTRALSLELESQNVRIACVMPGGTKTGFTTKRKVYSAAESDGYAKELRLATDALARTEQRGNSPEKVAKTIFSACIAPQYAVLSSGILNKLYHVMSRLLPEKVLLMLLRSMYFSQPEDR